MLSCPVAVFQLNKEVEIKKQKLDYDLKGSPVPQVSKKHKSLLTKQRFFIL